MFLIGLVIIGFGLLLWEAVGFPIWITGTIGCFNFLLGIITPRSPKVNFQPEPSGMMKLLVDKVSLRHRKFLFDSYELVFLDSRLVMKKLVSGRLDLSVSAFFFAVGGFVGGLTELSVQWFLEQRRRDKIRDQNEFAILSNGDTEIPYENMSQVQLTGLSLTMYVGGRLLVFYMGTEYPPVISRKLREIVPSQYWARSSYDIWN